MHIATLPAEFKEKDGADVRDVLALKDGESLLRQAMTDAREWKPTPEIAESDGVPSLLNPRERTDTANAARFAILHSKGILFAGPWSEWLLWDGQRWRRDELYLINERAKDVSRRLWERLAKEQTK